MWYSSNRPTYRFEREANALEIAKFLYSKKWTRSAIAGVLANMQIESTINPGVWENFDPDPEHFREEYDRDPGYGLLQWTPYTRIYPAAADDGEWQINYLQRELEWGTAWNANIEPHSRFASLLEYSRSNFAPEILAVEFELHHQIHAGDPIPTIPTYAREWYNFIPPNVDLLLLINNKRRYRPYV